MCKWRAFAVSIFVFFLITSRHLSSGFPPDTLILTHAGVVEGKVTAVQPFANGVKSNEVGNSSIPITADGTALQTVAFELVDEINLTTPSRTQMASILPPAVAVFAFIVLILISLHVAKKQSPWHPGGVIGSVIHYPGDPTESPQESKLSGYQVL